MRSVILNAPQRYEPPSFRSLMVQSLAHKSSCRTDLFINQRRRVCMLLWLDRALMCASSLRGREWRRRRSWPSNLYNSCLFKPWYLSGQVEVCCLTSSMRPRQGALSCE